MAHHKAGNAEEARRYYEEALERMQDIQPSGAAFPQSFFRDEAAGVLGIAADSPDETTRHEPERPPLESTEGSPSQGRDAAAENSQGREPLEPEGTGNAKP